MRETYNRTEILDQFILSEGARLRIGDEAKLCESLTNNTREALPIVLAILAKVVSFSSMRDLVGVLQNGIVQRDVDIRSLETCQYYIVLVKTTLTVVYRDIWPARDPLTNYARLFSVQGDFDKSRNSDGIRVLYACINKRVIRNTVNKSRHDNVRFHIAFSRNKDRNKFMHDKTGESRYLRCRQQLFRGQRPYERR